MKTILPIVCAVAFLLLGAFIQRAAAETIDYEKLPQAAVPSDKPTGSVPSAIPSNETVQGIFVAPQSSAARKSNEARGYYYAGIFGSETDAKAYTSGRPAASGSAQTKGRACISQSRDSSGDTQLRLSHYSPPPPSASAKAVPVKPVGSAVARKVVPPVKRSPVRFIHMEKLEVSGAQAKLDRIDAWVDLMSLGAREIARSSMTLQRIAKGPNGVEVYATRDEKAAQILVRAPSLPLEGIPEKEKQRYIDELDSVVNHLGVQTQASGGFDSSDCGHLRFALEYDKGSGQMATIVSTAVLKGGVEEEVDDPKPKTDEEEEEQDRALAVRTRLLLGTVSLSQSSSEKAPILSISWGWGMKAQIVRF